MAVGADSAGGDLDAAVWISTNGVDWSRVPHDDAVFGGPGDQSMLSVVAGGPGLVAVGVEKTTDLQTDAAVWTSRDGLVWSRVRNRASVFGGPSSDQSMFGVVAGGPGLVAVGVERPSFFVSADRNAAVWTSRDGLVWSRVPHRESVFGGPGDQYMFGATVGGPGLVAVGLVRSLGGSVDAVVWTSSNGLVWSRVADDGTVFGGPGNQQIVGVTQGGPGLVAVGSDQAGRDSDAAVWTSSDGLEWSRIPHIEAVFGGDSSQAMSSVASGIHGLVAVGLDLEGGDRDAAVWTSPDGVVWHRVSHDESVFGGDFNQQAGGVIQVGLSYLMFGTEDSDRGFADVAFWTGPIDLAFDAR